MALFYLVRHGEANYDDMLENGFWGFGRDFAPLSEKGKQQAEIMAKDTRLKNAELIVSSPYTRALQTAQIISRETGIRVEVEIDLHEWIPDENNQYETSEESFAFAREFTRFNGEYPPREKYRYPVLTITLTGDYKVIYQRFLDREGSPDRHRGHVVNDCYPEKRAHNPKERKAASISYENYVYGIDQRGFDAFLVGGRQIKVDTTDFSKIDMEELFSQISAWKEEILHD